MSYAISVPVGGYFSAQIRAGFATKKVIGSVLTLLIYVVTPRPRPDVYMAVERFDALLTDRDNQRIESAKQMAFQSDV